LARLPIADDQLALAAADRDHRVDRLDARLERLGHGLALDDAGRLHLDAAPLLRLDRALAVDGLPEGVDDAPDDRLTDRDVHDPAGALDRVALLDEARVAEERGADVVLLEVEHQAHQALSVLPCELEELAGHRPGEPVDA